MKRIITIILSIALVLGIAPVSMHDSAYAEEEWIEIYTIEDLDNIRNNLSGNYILMNDIDMSETNGGEWDAGTGWKPIGDTNSTAGRFSGVFDGHGYTISNMYCKASYGGLFGYNKGTIKNLHMKNCYVTSTRYAGTICADNTGNIYRCSAENGEVTGVDSAGGIAGWSDGAIKECYNSSMVSASGTYAGGIVGKKNSKTIINDCYNLGNINGSGIVGGGYSSDNNPDIQHCYNIGNVEYGISRDYIAVPRAQHMYMLVDTHTKSNEYGTDKTDSQMRLQGTYVDWDFDNVWVIDNTTSYPYPQLRYHRQDTNKVVEDIEWKVKPSKSNYFKDEAIDVSDAKFTAYCIDDTSEVINVDESMLSDFDMTKTGKQTVTVTFRGKTLTFDINVREIYSVTELSGPNKTTFVKGTEFDFTGWTLRVICQDGTSQDVSVTPEMTTGGDITKVGEYTVSCVINDTEFKHDVSVIPIKVSGIKIEKLPNKVDYEEGEPLDVSGMIVKAIYNNGTETEVDDYTLSGYDATLGTHTVIVSYMDFKAEYDVEVGRGLPIAINVTKMPEKTEYVEGQAFDKSGMGVEAIYASGFSKPVEGYVVSAIPKGIGSKKITISYENQTTYIYIKVIERVVEKIVVDCPPDQTDYYEGQQFDSSGMIVLSVYNDGTADVVTDYEISGADTINVGTHEVTVLYDGMTTSFTINVFVKMLSSISVIKPEKTEYLPGEEFDPEGMVVKAKYNNGKTVTLNKDDYTVTGFTGEPGNNIITVKYEHKSNSFTVHVHNPSDEWVVTKESTCTATGRKVQHCLDCGKEVYTAEIKMKDHTSVSDPEVDPTCTTTGKTQGSHCAVCGKVLVAQSIVSANGHSFGEWEIVTDSGCANDGSQQRQCSVCGTIETKDVSATGHSWNSTYTVDREATCLSEGSRSIHCSKCGATKMSEVIPKLDHVYKVTITKEASCTENGLKIYSCTTCGYSYNEVIPMLEHVYSSYVVKPTCTELGYTLHKCALCSETYRDEFKAGTHMYESNITTQPTCTKSGVKKYICSACGDSYTETIKANGHKEEIDRAVEATCTTLGKTEGSHCTVCGETIKAQYTIAMKEHTEVIDKAVQATCGRTGKTEGAHCSVCGAIIKEQIIIPAREHEKVVDKAVAATCTKAGKTAGQHCSICGEVIVEQNTIAAKGHTEVVDQAIEPTCITSGKTEGSHCSVCGEVLVAQERVPATGHNYNTIVNKATLSANGKVSEKCQNCGKTKVGSEKVIYKVSSAKLAKTEYVYSGSYIKPAVTIMTSNGTKVSTANYTVEYSNNKSVGKATVVITFKNEYTGSKTLTFKINPKGTAISTVTATKAGFKATWKKQATQTTGYQIRYSLKSSMASAKTVTIAKNSTLSKSVSKLKSKKKYYVQVRTYKAVSGTKYYSVWSDKKSVITK